MRNLHNNGYKWDKMYFLAFLITLFCAIVCGIVLYKPVLSNTYFRDFASDYIFNIYNFKNSSLLFSHLLSDIIYLYIIFFICYFTKLKYLTLVLIFLRGLFFGVYAAILVGVNSFGGSIVLVFVFMPATLISLAFCCLIADCCKRINRKYAIFIPLVLAIIDLIIYALLINVVFRVLIAIV